MMLAGCVASGTNKVTVQEEQLIHHRFVLETVNGEDVPQGVQAPELNFNEDMHLSGNMCNRFTGKGSLSEGVLKAKKVAMTKKLCTDPKLNQLDATIGKMLRDGAQVDLTENQLTLANDSDSLIYKLADRVQ